MCTGKCSGWHVRKSDGACFTFASADGWTDGGADFEGGTGPCGCPGRYYVAPETDGPCPMTTDEISNHDCLNAVVALGYEYDVTQSFRCMGTACANVQKCRGLTAIGGTEFRTMCRSESGFRLDLPQRGPQLLHGA